MILIRPDNHGTTLASFSFLSNESGYQKLTADQQKAILKDKLAGAGWEAPRLTDEIEKNNEIYFDGISQVHAPRWFNDRLGIIGDAAYCPTPLTGKGTTLAILMDFIRLIFY